MHNLTAPIAKNKILHWYQNLARVHKYNGLFVSSNILCTTKLSSNNQTFPLLEVFCRKVYQVSRALQYNTKPTQLLMQMLKQWQTICNTLKDLASPGFKISRHPAYTDMNANYSVIEIIIHQITCFQINKMQFKYQQCSCKLK